ncbi:MAG TPA: hypothetical protein VNF07_13320 [Acidimicrobiales bacterium]|nr:hypothetical protein [Acidimicrobiales bacterium]
MRTTVRIAMFTATLLAVPVALCGVAGAQSRAAVRVGHNPRPLPCSSSAPVAIRLSISAGASLQIAAGQTLGTAGATQLAQQFEVGIGDLCTAHAPAKASAEFAVIRTIYATNKNAAVADLLQWAKNPNGPTTSPPRRAGHAIAHRAVAHTTGPCPSLSPTIDVSSASGVTSDLAALQFLQALGFDDNNDFSDLVKDTQQQLEQWVNGANPTTVGDWLGIAEAAQLLGDDSLANSAIGKAQGLAASALKKATPSDPCSASQQELDCYQQAAALSQMLGDSDVTSPAALVAKCQARWSIEVTISGGSAGSTSTIHYSTGEFVVSKTGLISPPPNAGKSWPGTFTGAFSTGNCPGQLHAFPTAFTYSVTGQVHGTAYVLVLNAPNLHISLEKTGSSICINAAYGIIKLILPIFQKWPVEVNVPAGQTSATSTMSSGGTTITTSLKKLT